MPKHLTLLRQSLWEMLNSHYHYIALTQKGEDSLMSEDVAKRINNIIEIEAPNSITLLILNLQLVHEYGLQFESKSPDHRISVFDALYSMNENAGIWSQAFEKYGDSKVIIYLIKQILAFPAEMEAAIALCNLFLSKG